MGPRGVARLNKVRGGKGAQELSEGADRDSNWQLSLDLCRLHAKQED